MQVEIKIDSACTEPRAIILTNRVTDEVRELADMLAGTAPRALTGMKDGVWEVLEQADIIHIYAAAGKVYAVNGNGEYALRQRLYELERRLEKSGFVRISNSELVNLKKVKSFDLSFAGTICVKLSDGTVTYASRRYVSRVKQILGI